MKVQKRNGCYQSVDLNKITVRLKKLIDEMGSDIEVIAVAQKVCNALHDGVTTHELDKLASEIAMSLNTVHPDYGKLAAYIVVSDIHKNLRYITFTELANIMFQEEIITSEVKDIAAKYSSEFESIIDYNND